MGDPTGGAGGTPGHGVEGHLPQVDHILEAREGEAPQQMSEAELAELRQQQEQQQAMEQWLRRIPDDPGGLLRRKFRHQYQRLGKDQDGNSVWPDNEVQPW